MLTLATPKAATIEQFWYCRETKTLSIKFKGKFLYLYSEVPEQIFWSFCLASSKGEFQHAFIKDVYKFAKVEADAPVESDIPGK